MKSCACSLAGTKACDTCVNGPANWPDGYELPSLYEPVETQEELIRRVIKEELNRLDKGQE